MSRLYVTLIVIIFGLLQMTGPGASLNLHSSSNSTHPNCTERCGNVSIQYPFGIESGCFRQSDFSLTCNGSGSNQPPKIFLHDGTTEVLADSGNTDRNGSISWCTNSCPQNITETVARQNCNGTGCCSVHVGIGVRDFTLKFVRHNGTRADRDALSNRSSLWDRINITTNWAEIYWDIVDQPTCARAKEKNINYACVSNHSECSDEEWSDLGYECYCNSGYVGNPYVLDGCKRDEGYSPRQLKENCSQWCGNISVPYPFGLEEGCSARKLFELNCTNMTSSMLQFDDGHVVVYINISESLVGIRFISNFEDEIGIYVSGEPDLFGFGESVVSVHWAAANLTCEEALKNKSQYACVSLNSECLGVNSKNDYVGYRCKCLDGFQGNPYTTSNGCEDIDECQIPGICKENEVCHNVAGSYDCTKCPGKTEYDATTKQCTATKRQNLLLGVIIGLCVGFGILLSCLGGMLLIRRWKRDIQRKLRRKYFTKNQGLLLEQLISSDENASNKTKIFSLEELKKATNDFDTSRILGRGGHGMVYKGILSDQRVVAIKISKIMEQDEIDNFINEVAILSQINHRNIVRLFGCCLETEVPLLVYDFVSNGSLFEILHADASNDFQLSWDDCLRIASEAAGALYYLHSSASVSIFHRDVKSSNILLDGNYTAKVSDFGASRLVPIDQTHVVTNVQGTFGYLDPEYYHTGQLNEKSDVYSFGVVLVELLLRKKPVFTNETGTKQNLSNYFLWGKKMKPITEIVATQVLEEATEEEINIVASLAEKCLRLRHEERPTMKLVEMTLQFLRAERLNSRSAVPASKQELEELLCPSTSYSDSLASDSFMDNKATTSSQQSKGYYSLEQEFASSTLPR
ncbi:wall-associated receptor kinase 1-like isoform X2 [Miscanthus floridulus]|uniref:wall-associated receptor kinase 1-like isoform X2 n=1 Tax=Miscanthus floridulus TaxID=154761 RepID=UPI003459FA7D